MKQSKSLFYNWQTKIVCFLLAVVVYAVFLFSSRSEREINLPVTVIMPENYVAISNIPTTVQLNIQGSEEVIYLIDSGNFSLTADFSKVSREGIWSVPVEINDNGLSEYMDLSEVTIYTNPGNVRVYFEEK